MLARLLPTGRLALAQGRAISGGSAASKGVMDTVADAARAAASTVRRAAEGAKETGPAGDEWSRRYAGEEAGERRFKEHGEEVEHGGAVAMGQGESDEELVAERSTSGVKGPAAMAAGAAAGDPSEKWGADEYPDSGEFVEGGDQGMRRRRAHPRAWAASASDEEDSEGEGGSESEASDAEAARQQSDRRYDDEYSGPAWVKAPGGMASHKWMRWKKEADSAMQGGKPEPGIVLE